MFALVLLLLIVVPVVELYVLSEVADALGWWPSIGILLTISLLGGFLMRWQAAGAIARVTKTIRKGTMPTNELTDAALMIFGAALLLTPGFFTDAFGLAMFIPPTRAMARKLVLSKVNTRVTTLRGAATDHMNMTFGSAASGATRRNRDGSFIDVEEVHVERVDLFDREILSGDIPPGAQFRD